MSKVIYDEKLPERLGWLQLDLAWLQAQVARTDKEREQHYQAFHTLLGRLTSNDRTKSN